MSYIPKYKSVSALSFLALIAAADPASAKDADVQRLSLLYLIGGTQELFECHIPPTDQGTTTASCHRHQLLDLRRDKIVGTVLDATADESVIGDAVTATGTTTFTISNGVLAGSTLQVRGRGTIQPVLVGEPRFRWSSRAIWFDKTPITHIAGIFPNPGDNQVLAGTGAFRGAKGTFALFGGLDLSEAGQASFNCIYKIDLEIPRKNWDAWLQQHSSTD